MPILLTLLLTVILTTASQAQTPTLERETLTFTQEALLTALEEGPIEYTQVERCNWAKPYAYIPVPGNGLQLTYFVVAGDENLFERRYRLSVAMMAEGLDTLHGPRRRLMTALVPLFESDEMDFSNYGLVALDELYESGLEKSLACNVNICNDYYPFFFTGDCD